MKIKKILPQTIKSEVSFIDEIKNFDIVTEKMNDSFYTYRLESNVMMWLNDEGIIGEIECIFPKQLDKEISLVKNQKILTQQGFPLIDTETEITVHEISIFKGANYFTLYLTKSANYNKEIISENLVFYLHDMELIAIKATVSE
ncbi:hypothetical protein [Listeria monocytogenes]|uniref:hypothetical protein n=1 Tax=Listeria monocytogenes TaxID=1639 RepID=UPI00085448FC|nr:hypothetical protein [Listeria monocytogenes]EAC3357437.1 hypothetical protein [Listeria monocytogenes]EAC3917718.1 hypothetical protein [Listeria monocytogenes]EAC9532132.1 hypothetical protein [Listeria monocytogenes]EAD2776276.1 hypothetical protein [Listeria monocytogenes]EAE1293666.1 hypothetical protein [Listeria monocytogenes]